MGNPYYDHPRWEVLSKAARLLNDGGCRYCGREPADHAHHAVPGEYPPVEALRQDQLTGLCEACHRTATTVRRINARGVPIPRIHAVIAECLKTEAAQAALAAADHDTGKARPDTSTPLIEAAPADTDIGTARRDTPTGLIPPRKPDIGI